ncbi:MAG: TonB-dependent receptor [Acidobacteriota bacterium]
MIRVLVGLPLLILVCRAPAIAGPGTAGIEGRIFDATGAALVHAAVSVKNTATGLDRQTVTDKAGYYSIPGLPITGRYILTVSMAGFATRRVANLSLRAGVTASVDVTLSPQIERSQVTVLGTTEGVRSDSPQIGNRLDLEKINETPILGQKITALPLIDSAVRPARGTGDMFLNNVLFVVNGSGRRQTSYQIDGSSADDTWGRQTIFTNIPLSAIQEFEVLPNSFNAEYGRTTGPLVNVVSKTGTNGYHGEGVVVGRPSGIEARDPVSTSPTADRLAQFSGTVSGPIIHDRTFFLISGQYAHQDRDSSITSPLGPGVFTGRYRQGLFFARIDHQINAANTLTARINFDRASDTNPADAVGGLSLPSAARTFARRTYDAVLSETAVLSPSWLNSFHAQLQVGSPITQFQPADPSTQYVYPGVATIGESRGALLGDHQIEARDTVSGLRGRQSFQFGFDAIHSSSGGNSKEFGGPFVLGRFVVKPGIVVPVSQLTIDDIQQYTQGFGNASYNVQEWLLAGFAQDDIKLRSDFTLNLGLRYSRQTFTDGTKDFSPRVGFAYNVHGDARTVLRGSYGIYFSEVPANSAADWLLNGPTGYFNFTVAPGQPGFPTSLAPLPAFPPDATLPPRDISVRPGDSAFLSQFFDVSLLKGYPDKLLNPYTQLATFGIERDLGGGWIMDADYVHQLTLKILRPADLNSPSVLVRTQPGQTRSAAAADPTRPIVPEPDGYRSIVANVNQGNANYDGLQVNLNKHFSHGFSLLASYTWSHTIDTAEMDVPNVYPNDSNLLGGYERGNSLLDQRHRAVISGWWQLPGQFVTGGIATLASGFPYNFTTGADNNGDGARSDRPVINGAVVGRDTGRGSAIYDFSPFVARQFHFGDRVTLLGRAEAFNVFNHPNIVGRNGVYGNSISAEPLPSFGQPLGGINNVEPGREFQFMIQVEF